MSIGERIPDERPLVDQLARYFEQRGEFLASLIASDLRSLKRLGMLAPAKAQEQLDLIVSQANDPSLQSLGEATAATAAGPSNVPTPVPTAVAAELATTDLDQTQVERRIMLLVEEQTGFPAETLSGDMLLLDDLNLDSIKAAELIGSASIALNVVGAVDPTEHANSTIAEVAATLLSHVHNEEDEGNASSPQKTDAPSNDTALPDWVRSFATTWIETPRADDPIALDTCNVLIVFDASSRSVANSLEVQLRDANADSTTVEFAQLSSISGTFSHVVACLPAESVGDGYEQSFRRHAARLHQLATTTSISETLLLVQEHVSQSSSDYLPSCASGFVKSLHAERPNVAVRILDWDSRLNADDVSKAAISELQTSAPVAEAQIDSEGRRWEPRIDLIATSQFSDRGISWTADDVVLITGGAKGVTAECAIRVGEQTGARLALVGRSPWRRTEDDEVSRTMSRCVEKNIDATYFQCDVADKTQVDSLIGRVRNALGPITGVVHGAGLNVPRRLEQSDLDAAVIEASPKVLGARHLMTALDESAPKLFVSITSIIGVTGMPGNGWYALANELLAKETTAFAAKHQNTQAVSLAYSVWDEVGMGAKLGSLDNLSKMGIGAIPVADGVERFWQLFQGDPAADQVIITARLGGLATWPRADVPAPVHLRFIEDLVYFEPDVALVAEAHLTAERDEYVRDHDWRGSLLFPTVFGLEAMAQAVVRLTGEPQPSFKCIQRIRLQRPIIVEREKGSRIRIIAQANERHADGTLDIDIGIYCEQTGFLQPHFAATFVLGDRNAPEKHCLREALGEPIAVDMERDIYGTMLFQGPLYQRLESIHELRREYAQYCATVRCSSELGSTGFADVGQGTGEFVLGDPYFRDVLLHCCQLNIPQDLSLPISIDEITFFAPPTEERGKRQIQSILNDFDGSEYDCDVLVTNEDGVICESLTNYRLRVVEQRPESPTATDLANPESRDQSAIVRELDTASRKLKLKPTFPQLIYEPDLGRMEISDRRTRQLHGVQSAAQRCLEHFGLKANGDLRLDHTDDGQPVLTGAEHPSLGVSLSHDDIYGLATVGLESQQGCDIESVMPRTRETWQSMLGDQKFELLGEIESSAEALDASATRIWTAYEALFKATQRTDLPLKLARREANMVLFTAEDAEHDCQFHVLSMEIQLTRRPSRMIAIVVEKAIPDPRSGAAHDSEEDASELIWSRLAPRIAEVPEHLQPYVNIQDILAPDSHRVGLAFDSPQGQPVFEHRFQVGFRESCTLGRTVSAPRVINWVAKMREMPLRSMGPKMVEEFSEGKFGLVTNTVSAKILGEATSYDTIHSRCWMGNTQDSTFTGYFDFCKLEPDQSLTRIAISEVTSTYVEMQKYGVPKPAPFPDYLDAYLKCYSSIVPAAVNLRDRGIPGIASRHQPLENLDLGSVIAEFEELQHGERHLLGDQVFQTTLEESNLVGNIYFSNYFIWQNRLLDIFLFEAAPELLRVSRSHSELLTTFTRMLFLREAMPFDRVRVKLYPKCVYECGADFLFEFFIEEGTRLHKIQTGEQQLAWVSRADAQPIPQPWPKKILDRLLHAKDGAVMTGN